MAGSEQTPVAKRGGARHRNGNVRRIWLHIMAEGGRWSTPEIMEALPGVDHSTVCQMVTHGLLRRFAKSGKGMLVRYGITADCMLPQGVSIEDLARVGFGITTPAAVDPS